VKLEQGLGYLEGKRLESMSDEQLVALTQEGDLAAFNRLAQRWEKSLYGFARRQLGNEEDASDVCQEALVKAYQNIKRLREGTKFKAWVHHITYNLCRDRFRSGAARRVMHSYEEWDRDEDGEAQGLAGAATADGDAHQAKLRALLGHALGELPDEQRRTILLREYHGFTSEEIAEMTGVPAATVRTRIYYGLRAMRKHLGERGLTAKDID
jgi:RNA polymerase sigma-70 factor, ECF subfamily